ncbi:MAG: hypothetical protein OXF26_08155 [Alphaproteobacteria bacterium]|nr:hypothetical protein [Alphaproteobacteria bacterium]
MPAVVVDAWKSFDELELRETPLPTLGHRHVRISAMFALSVTVLLPRTMIVWVFL